MWREKQLVQALEPLLIYFLCSVLEAEEEGENG